MHISNADLQQFCNCFGCNSNHNVSLDLQPIERKSRFISVHLDSKWSSYDLQIYKCLVCQEGASSQSNFLCVTYLFMIIYALPWNFIFVPFVFIGVAFVICGVACASERQTGFIPIHRFTDIICHMMVSVILLKMKFNLFELYSMCHLSSFQINWFFGTTIQSFFKSLISLNWLIINFGIQESMTVSWLYTGSKDIDGFTHFHFDDLSC